MIAIISIFLLLFLILFNVPIGIAIGAVALAGMIINNGFDSSYNAALAMFDGATSFPLIAIPLFILAGALMNTSGISQRLITFTSDLVGFVRGGLSMVNVCVSMFFAEISGSAVADVAATGSVLIPGMKKRGYGKNFSAAITSSSASLAVIIPPSMPMILYGAISDTSIVQLFIAGIIPGILGGFGLMLACYVYAVKHDLPREEAFDLRRLGRSFKEAFWAFLLPVIILGGIFSGLVTATEGAGLAVVAALFIGLFIYRDLELKLFYKSLVEGVLQTSSVMLIVATSAVLGMYFSELQLPQQLTAAMLSLTENKWVILMLFNLMFFVLGMFLHGAAAIILVIPIVMPLVHQLGIDPVHFGVMVTLNIAIGQQTPPVASVLVTACSIAKADIWEVTKRNIPMIGVLITVLMLVTYIPSISLTLVEYFYR